MFELKSVADVPLILTFFVPGVLLQWGRAVFHPSVAPKVDKESVGGILVISAIYAIAASTTTGVSGAFLRTQPDAWASLYLFLYSIAAPFLVGLAVGFCERSELFARTGQRYQLPVASSLRTGWDAMASGVRQGSFVIVTLEGGHKIYGVIGKDARLAASGEVESPDFFLDEVCAASPGGGFQRLRHKRGVWIPGSGIQTIEVVNPQ